VIGASGCTGFGRDSSGWVSAYYWRRSRVIVWLPVSCRSASDRPRRSPHRAGWWCSTTRALDLRCRPPMSPSRQIPQALLSRANVPSPYAHGADRARTGTPANRAPDRGPRRRPRCPPLVDYGPLAADTGYPQRAETAQLARDCFCNLGVPDCTSPMATQRWRGTRLGRRGGGARLCLSRSRILHGVFGAPLTARTTSEPQARCRRSARA
jgi:hypothetical protein